MFFCLSFSLSFPFTWVVFLSFLVFSFRVPVVHDLYLYCYLRSGFTFYTIFFFLFLLMFFFSPVFHSLFLIYIHFISLFSVSYFLSTFPPSLILSLHPTVSDPQPLFLHSFVHLISSPSSPFPHPSSPLYPSPFPFQFLV